MIVNELLSELYGATGIQALPNLLVTELFPPAARVSAAQVRVTKSHLLLDQIVFAVMFVSALPMSILFPVINAIFTPSYYILLMALQPILIIYIVRNLPETASKSVYDIVHQMDEEVRSRVWKEIDSFRFFIPE